MNVENCLTQAQALVAQVRKDHLQDVTEGDVLYDPELADALKAVEEKIPTVSDPQDAIQLNSLRQTLSTNESRVARAKNTNHAKNGVIGT